MKLRFVVVLCLVVLSVLALSLTAVAQPSAPARLAANPVRGVALVNRAYLLRLSAAMLFSCIRSWDMIRLTQPTKATWS